MGNNPILEQLADMRIVTLGEIEPKSVANTKREIMEQTLRSPDPILLLIDSPGGHVDAGWSLIDFMMMLEVSIVGLVNGMCASMAVKVLQACTHRWMTRHSHLFLHALKSSLRYSFDDDLNNVVKDDNRISEVLFNNGLDFLCKRAKKSREEIEKRMKLGDKFGGMLFPDEALEWGLIDKIVDPGEFKLIRHVAAPRPRLVPLKLE